MEFPVVTTPSGQTQWPVKVCINNEGPFPMTFERSDYEMGAVAEGQSWPRSISSGKTMEVYSVDMPSGANGTGTITGCSGYAVYEVGVEEKVRITIAFCNVGGENKVAVGTRTSVEVFKSMASWGYNPRTETVTVDNKQFVFTYQCTAGNVNVVTVSITLA